MQLADTLRRLFDMRMYTVNLQKVSSTMVILPFCIILLYVLFFKKKKKEKSILARGIVKRFFISFKFVTLVPMGFCDFFFSGCLISMFVFLNSFI